MKKIFFLSILLLQVLYLCSSHSFAQNFVPLNLGNVWVWEDPEWGTIEKSTLLDTNYFINSKTYSQILLYNSSDIYQYARYDEQDNLFYRYQSNYPYNDGDVPYYKRNCPLGDTFSYPLNQFAIFTKEVVDVYQTNVFDTTLTVKIIHWSAGGLVEGTEIWTDELGMLYKDNTEGGGVEFILKGCVINGRVYGDTTMTVNVDDDPITAFNFRLYQNFPNPFNSTTVISFSVAENSFVSLKVYDVLGNEISEILGEVKEPGNYSVSFDASALSSGIYFYTLKANGYSLTKKMILAK